MEPFSLYIHIPYCDSKCPYCDFNSYAAKRWPERRYGEALIAEMTSAAALPAWRGARLQTIFFGGGTPSLFAPETIADLISAACQLWQRTGPRIEVTLEANPGTVDPAKLRQFAAAGVNRMSFGVQSFQPAHLARLGRIHSADEAREAVSAAREVGFDGVNLDLMFAIPGQTPAEWASDLAAAVELGTDHVSAYNLTYEDGTPFGAWRHAGSLVPLPEEVEVAMFTTAQAILAEHGFAQYEISNYAIPGRECRHNLNYWRAGAYLGVGAGAHSFDRTAGGRRWCNEKSPGAYMARIAASGHARVSEEQLTPAQARGEFVFLGLRCRAGIIDAEFEQRFGVEVAGAFPHVTLLVRDGLLEHVAGHWRLTDRGLLLGDSVFATFL